MMEFGRVVERRSGRKLAVQAVAVLIDAGQAGRDGSDDAGHDARHSVQIVNTARVVNSHFLAQRRLFIHR